MKFDRVFLAKVALAALFLVVGIIVFNHLSRSMFGNVSSKKCKPGQTIITYGGRVDCYGPGDYPNLESRYPEPKQTKIETGDNDLTIFRDNAMTQIGRTQKHGTTMGAPKFMAGGLRVVKSLVAEEKARQQAAAQEKAVAEEVARLVAKEVARLVAIEDAKLIAKEQKIEERMSIQRADENVRNWGRRR
jgi:hypothetical protein